MKSKQTGASGERRALDAAKDKTREVREELEVAGAELQLTNTILEQQLPAQQKVGEVRKAIDQNGAVADTVADARQELAEVEALLAQEIEQRERLEHEMARRG